jgi:hypothetical protein
MLWSSRNPWLRFLPLKRGTFEVWPQVYEAKSLPVLANAAPETINSKAIEVATALIDKRISGGFSGPPDRMHGACHQGSSTTLTRHVYVVVNK